MERPTTALHWRVHGVAHRPLPRRLVSREEKVTTLRFTTRAASTKGWSAAGTSARRLPFQTNTSTRCCAGIHAPYRCLTTACIWSSLRPLQRIKGLRRGPFAEGILDVASRGLCRMLQGANPGWTHGRQRGQFGSQTLHSAFFAHQHHHARNRFSDARRNHLGQIRQCRVVVRLGLVPIRFQPVSARRARVLARVFQGRLQAPSQQKGARGGSAGHDSSRRFHSTHQVDLVLSNRASISGQSSPHRSRWSCQSDASKCTPSPAMWFSIRSTAQARRA